MFFSGLPAFLIQNIFRAAENLTSILFGTQEGRNGIAQKTTKETKSDRAPPHLKSVDGLSSPLFHLTADL
jgi:hypothetical protein